MRKFRIFLVTALLAFFFGVAAWADGEDRKMGTDNMGDGAEYSSGEDRALKIDEAGDGNYDEGDGSVVESPGGGDVSSGDSGE
jgi:hypothetical protein